MGDLNHGQRETLASTVAERVRATRTARGLTMQALANRAGISKMQVIRIENGRVHQIKLGTVRAIADVLDVSPGWLAFGDEVCRV